MPRLSTGMPTKEVLELPSLFLVGGYRVFFWSNEGNEPVHVHVAYGPPSSHSSKVWLTESGGAILADNTARIPSKDINELLAIISAQHAYICEEWKRFFMVESLSFYC